MANYMAEVFAPIEARYHAQVIQATWGHLAPVKNRIYRGHVVFAVGCFGDDGLNPTAIESEFTNSKGEELESSPWFYDALTDLLGSFVGIEYPLPGFPSDDKPAKAGGVYRWEGTFRNYEFKGTLRRLQLV